jgi:hypothetical protein
MVSRPRRRAAMARTPGDGTGEIRVAIVTRISTDEVNQPYSLEARTKGLEAFVSSQPGHVITHRFVDQASGATLERPGPQAALAAAKAGEFDVLLVYRIDRLTRSIVGLMTIVEVLDAAGVALRSATEPIDTEGPVGRMLLPATRDLRRVRAGPAHRPHHQRLRAQGGERGVAGRSGTVRLPRRPCDQDPRPRSHRSGDGEKHLRRLRG